MPFDSFRVEIDFIGMSCLPLFRRLHELIGRHHVPGGLLHGTGAQVYGRHALEHCHCVVVYMIGWFTESGWVSCSFLLIPFTFLLVLVQLWTICCCFVDLSIELSMEFAYFPIALSSIDADVFKFINRFLSISISFIYYFRLSFFFFFFEMWQLFWGLWGHRVEH